MKKLYIQLLIALVFMGISQQSYAQINQRRSGEFQSVKGTGPTQGFPIFYTEDNYPPITFSGSQNSALNAHMAIINAQLQAYDQWLKRQKNVFKEEIEKQLGQNFSDFEKAQKAFYREKELENVKNSAENLEEVYRKKTSVKQELSSRCKRNIKLLDLRANEINAGNVNNSKYGHLKYGSTPIGDMRSLSQIENLRANEVSEFEINEWRLHNENNLFNLFKVLSELTNRDDNILNRPESTQLKYYDSFNDYEQLDLMQAYIHAQYYITDPFNDLPSPKVRNYGDISYVETYVQRVSTVTNEMSVFNLDYWKKLLPPGENTSIIEQLKAQAKHSSLKTEALNKALSEMSNPEFLTDVAIAGLGVRNEKFIKDDPDLNNEVRDYFKKNDHSKVASDCVNYLLNQYHNGGDFKPNTDLYKSAREPIGQSSFYPNRALGWHPDAQAKREGFLNFGNILGELLKNNANPRFEGYIIRDMFFINGLNVSTLIQNEWLGNAFYFRVNNGAYVDIFYENDNGITIANNNSNTNAYLNELVQDLNTRLNSSLTNDQKRNLFLKPNNISKINNYLDNNGNSNEAKELMIDYLEMLEDIPDAIFERFLAITDQLEDNPFLLLETDCNQIENWRSLAQHTAPQSVQNKIQDLKKNHEAILGDWNIQYIEDARGTIANMDYFAVNITDFPNNPDTGEQFTSNDFLDYFRRNINDFTEGTDFEPYCEISAICQQETSLWNSNNPFGSIIKLDIIGNDGVVVCADYQSNNWRFMTMEAPFDNSHPVSGTRQFGIESNPNGSYNIYVRGVDRFTSNLQENASYILTGGRPFHFADKLWKSFQEKINTFVKSNGGSSSIKSPTHNRPDWSKVKDVLKGIKPLSDLGCN